MRNLTSTVFSVCGLLLWLSLSNAVEAAPVKACVSWIHADSVQDTALEGARDEIFFGVSFFEGGKIVQGWRIPRGGFFGIKEKQSRGEIELWQHNLRPNTQYDFYVTVWEEDSGPNNRIGTVIIKFSTNKKGEINSKSPHTKYDASYKGVMQRGPARGHYTGPGTSPHPYKFFLTGDKARYDLAIGLEHTRDFKWPCDRYYRLDAAEKWLQIQNEHKAKQKQ